MSPCCSSGPLLGRCWAAGPLGCCATSEGCWPTKRRGSRAAADGAGPCPAPGLLLAPWASRGPEPWPPRPTACPPAPPVLLARRDPAKWWCAETVAFWATDAACCMCWREAGASAGPQRGLEEGPIMRVARDASYGVGTIGSKRAGDERVRSELTALQKCRCCCACPGLASGLCAGPLGVCAHELTSGMIGSPAPRLSAQVKAKRAQGMLPPPPPPLATAPTEARRVGFSPATNARQKEK